MAGKPDAGASDLLTEFPRASLQRIIKEALGDVPVQVSKEATTAISKATSVFVLYITATANDVAKSHHRSTLSADDLLKAIELADFQQFLPELKTIQAGLPVPASSATRKRKASTSAAGSSASSSKKTKRPSSG